MVDSNNGNIWAVTPDGARLIVSAADGLGYIQNPAALGDTLYFSAYDTDGKQSTAQRPSGRRGQSGHHAGHESFDETGNNYYAVRALTPFAGGLAFIDTMGPYENGVAPSDEVFVLTAGPTPTIKQLSIDPSVGLLYIPSLSVVNGPGGSSRLMFAGYGSGGPTSLYYFDSSQLNDPNPTSPRLPTSRPQTTMCRSCEFVASRVARRISRQWLRSPTKLWVSDGTAAGTAVLGSGSARWLTPSSLINAERPAEFPGQ